ncbi:MAG: SIMPL domain-containing protein [Aestuariivirgaceae bacterium]|nr:SIMPL domain-containing protein [Aestuariivirgaceae bacterium]
MPSTPSTILAGLLIGLGITAGGYLAGEGLVKSRLGYRVVTVKGLSERDVQADLGFWPVRFMVTGATLEEARGRLEASEAAVNAFLLGAGFAATDIQVQNIQAEDRQAGYNAGQSPEAARFVLTQDILVKSNDVQKLADASRKVGDLLRSGVVFTADAYNAGPSFIFTGVNALKGEMLTEATRRARESAQQFAAESGARVGSIQTANQGVVEINPAVAIPNDRPEKQIEKKVRVVTTITYLLVD